MTDYNIFTSDQRDDIDREYQINMDNMATCPHCGEVKPQDEMTASAEFGPACYKCDASFH